MNYDVTNEVVSLLSFFFFFLFLLLFEILKWICTGNGHDRGIYSSSWDNPIQLLHPNTVKEWTLIVMYTSC